MKQRRETSFGSGEIGGCGIQAFPVVGNSVEAVLAELVLEQGWERDAGLQGSLREAFVARGKFTPATKAQ